MNIPEKVKIGAHEYTIVFRDDLDDENFGVCRPHRLKIFIDSTVPRSQQEETFFHECGHAIRHALGQQDRDADVEETIVQPLFYMIYLFLKENDLLK